MEKTLTKIVTLVAFMVAGLLVGAVANVIVDSIVDRNVKEALLLRSAIVVYSGDTVIGEHLAVGPVVSDGEWVNFTDSLGLQRAVTGTVIVTKAP